MKKIIVLILFLGILLTACRSEMVARGVREYDPDADEPESIHLDFFYFYSNEEMVDESDVIGVAVVDSLSYVKVDLEDDSIAESRGMYAELSFTDVLYSSGKSIKDGVTVNVYIEYDPDYENIAEPDIEEDGEYLFFLAEFNNDTPAVFRDFFDYYIIGDFSKFRLGADEDTIDEFKDLIKSQK